LQQQYPNASIQSERTLRNTHGTRAVDPITEKGRNIYHVVIQDGNAIDSVDTTDLNVNKLSQLDKEKRIRKSGGNYVRDKTLVS
jgi:hypothetical protein